MSFDVFLQRFAAGQSAQVSREQVRAVLTTRKFIGPNDFGFFIVQFPDGVDVEFSAKGLRDSADFKGCAFHIRCMSPHLVRFMFEVAKAGDMVMLPLMEDFVPILSNSAQRGELPTELIQKDPGPVLCGSPEELESLLAGGFAEWQKYRDKVFGMKTARTHE
jgi:hypothetical protein